MMRRLLIATAVAGLLTGASGTAHAQPEVPTVPKDCHEWNALLHIQNVRSCDNPPYGF